MRRAGRRPAARHSARTPTIDATDLERAALADPRVRDAAGHRTVRRLVVKPPHLVNVVVD
jgi:hypothetical protein